MSGTTGKTIVWRILESRSICADEVVSDIHTGFDSKLGVCGTTKSGQYICGFATKDSAIFEATRLIDKAELQAKLQLLNVQKHRLHLEHSIKEPQP